MKNKIRFLTAASLFDGHDVAINIMRRILQAAGCEVIHLGHNRSAIEVATAAIQEDVHGIALSSYQGGHVEYLRYLVDLLRERCHPEIQVFAGGGGVITKEESNFLEKYGVTRIYSPQDGQAMGLRGMIDDMIRRVDRDLCESFTLSLEVIKKGDHSALTRLITVLHEDGLSIEDKKNLTNEASLFQHIPVLGITGTGGAGKSSLTDELLWRFKNDNPDIRIHLLAIDPSKRKSGGALLGDRIRMNALSQSNIFMRSLATRSVSNEMVCNLSEMIAACRLANADLVIVETPGIGQGDAGIVQEVDVSLYVMTPEFGASSQLEKIDMLDFADLVAINKCDRKGALDAIRDVRKQVQRNREAFAKAPEEMPVFGTVASHFNDLGVDALYHGVLEQFRVKNKGKWSTTLQMPSEKISPQLTATVPGNRQRYLAEIAETVRDYHRGTEVQVKVARNAQHLRESKMLLHAQGLDTSGVEDCLKWEEGLLEQATKSLLDGWESMHAKYGDEIFRTLVRDKQIEFQPYSQSLSGIRVPKVALPQYDDHGERLKWLRRENVPGSFPYTAGVFRFKREGEDPSRMFAGEGGPKRTNVRFKFLSKDMEAKRLSTAFDSVTLYGFDPSVQPDIYGKIGNSGVSIATLDDMKDLYDGFDLCDPRTSVSMTINGPAPTILAMFFNTAIDQKVEAFKVLHKRAPSADEWTGLVGSTLENVRGTVQADILKEDQGQNTCIFSTEFSLKVMGDIQEYFIQKNIKNFYSVSISGYHIAEAGANPISQLAFTLANGFTFVEGYLARSMKIDDFAPNFSFFFSNGMDPEYSVMGRVARRIWAIAMRDKYRGNARSQKLKYHLQTSGRSLHAQEMDFNDIRTTLEALIATYDHCNSLHTNAYDEAATTPTAESVRRALAIQLIINKEWGVAKNQNPNQGSFIFEQLTDLVEEAVLQEFERLSERGGVLGAMETGYQRSKIQEESLLYETKKHDGSLPLIGVNTYINPEVSPRVETIKLSRSTEEEKQDQIDRLRTFKTKHRSESPLMLERLKQSVRENGNVFAVLMDAVRICTLGEITHALFEVGGQYRRNM